MHGSNYVKFKGQVISSSVDIKVFTEFSKVIFDASNNPNARKLKGNYSWLFSLPLERQINPDANISKQLHIAGNETLPPTFGGRGAQSDIDYHFGVCVKRSGFFADESLYVHCYGTPHPNLDISSLKRSRIGWIRI